MNYKKLTHGMAAATLILCVISACGSKADADAKNDSTVKNNETTEAVTSNLQPVNVTVFTDSTASGLKYRVIEAGNEGGKSPAATDVVVVNYEGRLLNGNVFDSSFERGEPAMFPLNQVIAGWTEGLQLMKEGAVYEFLIPSELAYGERGAGAQIPPNSDLVFLVQLLSVQ